MEDTDAPITGLQLKGDKGTYILHQVLEYNPETRVRVYAVTQATELEAKEYNLEGLPPPTKRNRNREIRRLRNKRNVVDFARYNQRKIVIHQHRPRASRAEVHNGSATNTRQSVELDSSTPSAPPRDCALQSSAGDNALPNSGAAGSPGADPTDSQDESRHHKSEPLQHPGPTAEARGQPRRWRRPRSHLHDSSATVVPSESAIASGVESPPHEVVGTAVVSGPAFSDALQSETTTLGGGQSATRSYDGSRPEVAVELSPGTTANPTPAPNDSQGAERDDGERHLMYGPALIPIGPPIMDDRVGAEVVPVVRAPILVGRIGLVGCLLCSVGLGPNPIPYPTEIPPLLHEGLIEGVQDVVLVDQGAGTGIWFRRDGPSDPTNTEPHHMRSKGFPSDDMPINNERGRNQSV